MRLLLSFTSTDLLIGLSSLVLLTSVYNGFEFAQLPESSSYRSVSLMIVVSETALFSLLLTTYCVVQVAKLPLLEYLLLAFALMVTGLCPTYIEGGVTPQVPVWFFTTALVAFIPTVYPLYVLLCFSATSFLGVCLTLLLGTSHSYFSSSLLMVISSFVPISLVGLGSYYRTYHLAWAFISTEIAPSNVWLLLPYVARMEHDALAALWESFVEQEEEQDQCYRRASPIRLDRTKGSGMSGANGISGARRCTGCSLQALRSTSGFGTGGGGADKCCMSGMIGNIGEHSSAALLPPAPQYFIQGPSVGLPPPSSSSSIDGANASHGENDTQSSSCSLLLPLHPTSSTRTRRFALDPPLASFSPTQPHEASLSSSHSDRPPISRFLSDYPQESSPPSSPPSLACSDINLFHPLPPRCLLPPPTPPLINDATDFACSRAEPTPLHTSTTPSLCPVLSPFIPPHFSTVPRHFAFEPTLPPLPPTSSCSSRLLAGSYPLPSTDPSTGVVAVSCRCCDQVARFSRTSLPRQHRLSTGSRVRVGGGGGDEGGDTAWSLGLSGGGVRRWESRGSLQSFPGSMRRESGPGREQTNRRQSLILPSQSVKFPSFNRPADAHLSSSTLHQHLSFTVQKHRMVVELRRLVMGEIKVMIRSHRRHGIIGVMVGKRRSAMVGRKSSRFGTKNNGGGFVGVFGFDSDVRTRWMEQICGGGERYLTKRGSLCSGMVQRLLGQRMDGRKLRGERGMEGDDERGMEGVEATSRCDTEPRHLRRRRGGASGIEPLEPRRSNTLMGSGGCVSMDGFAGCVTRDGLPCNPCSGASGGPPSHSTTSVDAAVTSITIASGPPPPSRPATTCSSPISPFSFCRIVFRCCCCRSRSLPRCASPLSVLRCCLGLPGRIATTVHSARVLIHLSSINKPLFEAAESQAADSSARCSSNTDQVNRWLLDWLRGVTSLEYAPFLCWWQLTAMLINTGLTVVAQWWVGLYAQVSAGEDNIVNHSRGLSDTFFLYRVIIASVVDALLVLPQFFTLGVGNIHIFNIFSYCSVCFRCLCTLVDFSSRILYNVQDDLPSFGCTLINLASAPVLTRLSTKLFRLLFGLLFVLQNALFLACSSMSPDGVSSRDAALWGRMTVSYISVYLLMCGFFSRGEELAHRVRFSLFVLPYLVQLHDTTHNMQDKDEPDTISGHGQFYSAINGGL
eukprot:GHVS01067734.1.p1 GENE.GHVS01067734.1~~GHVS01067734.1.p1  ORF type:complete len:1189 (+),score=190.45 GHVS01067734.1:1-3567(+)